jgi:CRISPR-associated protein (TIGR03984 family)
MNSSESYTLKSLNSECKPVTIEFTPGSLDEQQALINLLNELNPKKDSALTYAVAYLDYRVLVGRFDWDNQVFLFYEQFDPKNLQRLRVFNADGELLLLREKSFSFRGRLRIDNGSKEAEDVEVIDAMQVLWGTKKTTTEHSEWSTISEERGTKLTLPFAFNSYDLNDKKKRVKLQTRNYISYNKLGQAGFTDCRFMALVMDKPGGAS